jgi:hypothetical protein
MLRENKEEFILDQLQEGFIGSKKLPMKNPNNSRRQHNCFLIKGKGREIDVKELQTF